jgi:hypothetical protein
VLRDFDQAQRRGLAHCGGDRVAFDPILFEVVEGDGQTAVVGAAVVRHLDFDAIEHSARGQAEDVEGRRLQHLDESWGELPPDRGLALAAGHGCTTSGL